MRQILLWMARNRLLKRWLPRIWFVRRATRRFMPGETVEQALTTLRGLGAEVVDVEVPHIDYTKVSSAIMMPEAMK